MFYFLGKNLWLTAASLPGIQFPENTDSDKGKLSVMTFLNNLLGS